jgi:hypothetical protein
LNSAAMGERQAMGEKPSNSWANRWVQTRDMVEECA